MTDWLQRRSGKFLLALPVHDQKHLPIRTKSSLGLHNLHVMNEFRNKLKQAEEMVAKLSYSLREIQRMPLRASAKSSSRPTPNRTLRLVSSHHIEGESGALH